MRVGWGGWTSLLGLDEGWVGRVDFIRSKRSEFSYLSINNVNSNSQP